MIFWAHWNRKFAAALPGVRQPHEIVAAVRDLIEGRVIRELVGSVIGKDARVVRSILFDKTAERNWGVPWHQDLTIAVAERRETVGFTGWSVKDGVNHVQAPREVLERMLAVRLHFDDCGAENGPLRVLPGTHRDGWLDTESIERAKAEVEEAVCFVERGGAVLMKPLLLHASSRATKPGHRRVLHLEFAAEELPSGLRYASGT
jgi:ectoine hydroxylase-related dioxygenase (phytanoyl-CoA dioxygenase family)